ncbi:MAG: NfeD family protein [Deinococcus sp.]
MTPALLWLGLGLLVSLTELLVPGYFLVLPGLAALLTGLALWFFPGLEAGADLLVGLERGVLPWLGFTLLLSVLLAPSYRRLVGARAGPTNRRGGAMQGELGVVVSWAYGRGRVRVGGSEWTAVLDPAGPDPGGAGESVILRAGEAVRVLGMDGTWLRVAREAPVGSGRFEGRG